MFLFALFLGRGIVCRTTLLLFLTRMTLQNILATISFPTMVIGLIYIGRKLQILDTLEADVRSIRDRFIIVEERVRKIDGLEKGK